MKFRNYDGQINIPDSLLLVDNFGKTGVIMGGFQNVLNKRF